MAIDLSKLHDFEQQVVAAMAFITTHMQQIEQIKSDIQDLLSQIATMKAESSPKN